MREKLDKVKRGLEACSIGTVCGPNCPYEDFRISDSEEEENYNCVATLARDALKLLKSAYTEPHCLTLEEAENVCHDTVCEFRYGIEPTRFPQKAIKAWINGVKYRYGKTWRCWTSWPTDEQREATPWEE